MAALRWLDDEDCTFPSTSLAMEDPNGLLAVGGDLSLSRLVEAYRHGIFPWFEEDQPILWWAPNPRCVAIPSDYSPSKSLTRRLRRQDYRITIDSDFAGVIHACQHRGNREGTWITEGMKQAYIDLHNAGLAHSVECYIDGELAGGLYGVATGRMFFGESMFHIRTDASKMAFTGLMQVLRDAEIPMVDCQMPNPHLFSLGAIEIPREDFEKALARNRDLPPVEWEQLRGDVNLSI